MLKIKDSVPSKILENLGFRKTTRGYYTYDFGTNTLFINNDGIARGHLWLSDECSFIPNIVYDLIRAGLVEKVEDNNE